MGALTLKMVFHQVSIKIFQVTRNFGRRPPQSSGFCTLFRKNVFQNFPSSFAVNCPENPKFVHFSKENLKNAFSKIGPKMSMGRVPTEIFGVGLFLSKVCQKQFSSSGTPKIEDFGPFFKNRCPKFLPSGKKRVFRVADFFEKSRK